MTRRSRWTTAFSVLALLSPGLSLADSPKAEPDLTGFKTVETAITAPITRGPVPTAEADSPVYLGILLDPDSKQPLVVVDVDLDSPAAKAGVKPGDVLLKVNGQAISDGEALLEVLRTKFAGEPIELALSRRDKPVSVIAILTRWSRPMPATGRVRVGLGVEVAAVKEGEGVTIEQILPGSVADRARLKVGEVLLKIDEVALTGPAQLNDLVDSKRAQGTIVATLRLAEKDVELKIKLDPEPTSEGRPFVAGDGTGPGGGPRGGGGPGGGQRGGGGLGGYWTKPSFRLAIVCVEYPDVKHNPKISNEAWNEALFSEGTYNKTNVTGQAVHGSFRDYFLEQSCGYFKVEGKVFDWVEVSKKLAEYATGNRMALLTESLDKVLARDGKDALKDFDGVFFLYAGPRYPAPRGSLYWPHRASVSHQGKRWPYFIVEEGGPRMQGLSVLCHEFGHMLGLPDLYARPENPGMEGLGSWCNMSQQPNRMIPEHFGAWVKEKVGWLKPAVIDPTVKQKLVLAPIENSPKECFKILIRPDGSEYLLLENRRKTGFDQSLPAEGLLIWHVLGNRPILKESHGIEGPSGPRMLLNEVPYPSGANDAYTPYTTPSSRSPLGGGLPVSITNIRRLPDGRIAFHVGYEYE
jgi:M6 family metalloprotease-like protein